MAKTLEELKNKFKFVPKTLPELQIETVERYLKRYGFSTIYAESVLVKCNDEEELEIYVRDEMRNNNLTTCKNCMNHGCKYCF